MYKIDGMITIQTQALIFFSLSLGRDNYVQNLDFEGLSVRELAEPTAAPANWVHHVLHILPQVCELIFIGLAIQLTGAK